MWDKTFFGVRKAKRLYMVEFRLRWFFWMSFVSLFTMFVVLLRAKNSASTMYFSCFSNSVAGVSENMHQLASCPTIMLNMVGCFSEGSWLFWLVYSLSFSWFWCVDCEFFLFRLVLFFQRFWNLHNAWLIKRQLLGHRGTPTFWRLLNKHPGLPRPYKKNVCDLLLSSFVHLKSLEQTRLWGVRF